MTAGQEPIAPASPAPFTPSGLVRQGALRVLKPYSAGAGCGAGAFRLAFSAIQRQST